MHKDVKRYIALFSLSLGAAASYSLVYIKYIFYDAWVAGLALPVGANEKAGMLLTWHMIGCTLLYIPGGYVADRFSTKNIIVLSLFGTGLLYTWYAFDPSYETSRIIWFLLAFTVGFAFWSGSVKAVRMLGSATEQGKIYGWYNSGVGAFAAVILGLATVVYGMQQVQSLSLFYASLVMASGCYVAAILTWIFFDEKQMVKVDGPEEEKFKAKDIIKVIKNPWVWCVAIMSMCVYSVYTGQSYITPYMTQVVSMSAVAGAVVGILRTRGARIVGSPVGGIIADRIGSTSLVVICSNLLMAGLLGLFLVLPMAQMPIFTIALSIFAALVNFAGYTILFACMEEARIPRYLTGTAVGIISILTYSPDGYLNTIFGYWLDKYGNGGYTYIFVSLIAFCLIGSVFAYLIYRHGRALRKAEAAQQESLVEPAYPTTD